MRREGLLDDLEAEFTQRCDVSHVVDSVRAVRIAEQHDIVRQYCAQFPNQLGRLKARTDLQLQAGIACGYGVDGVAHDGVDDARIAGGVGRHVAQSRPGRGGTFRCGGEQRFEGGFGGTQLGIEDRRFECGDGHRVTRAGIAVDRADERSHHRGRHRGAACECRGRDVGKKRRGGVGRLAGVGRIVRCTTFTPAAGFAGTHLDDEHAARPVLPVGRGNGLHQVEFATVQSDESRCVADLDRRQGAQVHAHTLRRDL